MSNHSHVCMVWLLSMSNAYFSQWVIPILVVHWSGLGIPIPTPTQHHLIGHSLIMWLDLTNQDCAFMVWLFSDILGMLCIEAYWDFQVIHPPMFSNHVICLNQWDWFIHGLYSFRHSWNVLGKFSYSSMSTSSIFVQ